jgi:hypothetical protein
MLSKYLKDRDREIRVVNYMLVKHNKIIRLNKYKITSKKDIREINLDWIMIDHYLIWNIQKYYMKIEKKDLNHLSLKLIIIYKNSNINKSNLLNKVIIIFYNSNTNNLIIIENTTYN